MGDLDASGGYKNHFNFDQYSSMADIGSVRRGLPGGLSSKHTGHAFLTRR